VPCWDSMCATQTQHISSNYFAPSRGESIVISLLVCLSAHLHILRTTPTSFNIFSVHVVTVAMAQSSSDGNAMLCTAGFVDSTCDVLHIRQRMG